MQKAKEIIATFLKVEPSQINENSLMDGSVIPGSVLLHRMFSKLSEEGYHVINQDKIRTYGDFLVAMNQNVDTVTMRSVEKQTPKKEKKSVDSSALEVGIDIEDILNMPVVTDFRESKFYSDNFSSKEISYCILQVDPRASFAGKFAAKEAIIKADNAYKSVPFKDIEILNDALGKPSFGSFSISISHTTNQAIAVAVQGAVVPQSAPVGSSNDISIAGVEKMIQSSHKDILKNEPDNSLNYIALALSIIAIASVVYQNL